MFKIYICYNAHVEQKLISSFRICIGKVSVQIIIIIYNLPIMLNVCEQQKSKRSDYVYASQHVEGFAVYAQHMFNILGKQNGGLCVCVCTQDFMRAVLLCWAHFRRSFIYVLHIYSTLDDDIISRKSNQIYKHEIEGMGSSSATTQPLRHFGF